MEKIPSLFEILSIETSNLSKIAKTMGLSSKVLSFYNDNNKFPVGQDLEKICKYIKKDFLWLKLKMGVIDSEVLSLLSFNSEYENLLK
jgi:hypothetical protein